MSALASFPAPKIITVTYGEKTVTVAIQHNDTPPTIQARVKEALGVGIPEFHLVDPKLNVARLNWQRLREDLPYAVKVPEHTGKSTRDDEAGMRIEEITQTWSLVDEYHILPRDIAPPQPPSLWSRRFVLALWKFCHQPVIGHNEALAMLYEVVKWRQGNPDDENCRVRELLRSDIDRASQWKAARLRNVANEALDYGTYVMGMKEGIEGVENRMHTEQWVGGIGDEIQHLQNEVEMEDGSILGNMRI